MSTTHPVGARARRLIDTAGRSARRNLRRVVEESRRPAQAAATAGSAEPVLSPYDALRQNGFSVYRGLFTADECARYAARLKAEAKITDGTKFTKIDATNFFPTARDIMLEGRILGAVRSSLGYQPRFLQVSDLHYLHDTAEWHRDSVHRALDSSAAPDWRDPENPYAVVKAILYMEADNAAMGFMGGSHASPIEMDRSAAKRVEDRGGQHVIDAAAEPNRRLTDAQKSIPLAWKAEVGDVLVFDERLYHCGRRVDAGRVSQDHEAPKFTLSLVFGADNHHSERLYSYFRFARRDLSYRDLKPDLQAELAARDLILDRGQTNFYRDEPDELRHVYLRDPAQLQPLIDEFRAAGPRGA